MDKNAIRLDPIEPAVSPVRLRTILLLLVLLALFSIAAGGYLYVHQIRRSADATLKAHNHQLAQRVQQRIRDALGEYMKSARLLAGMTSVRMTLERPERHHLYGANRLLGFFQKTLDVSVCYLMDVRGQTLAASNWLSADSFVGHNYGFRPYFQIAVTGRPATYMAMGVTSKKRGVYYSYPVLDENSGPRPIGVVVIKAPVAAIERQVVAHMEHMGDRVLITDPEGMVFMASHSEDLFRTFRYAGKGHTVDPNQAGDDFGLHWRSGDRATDDRGNRYLVHRMGIGELPGWHVISMTREGSLARQLWAPFEQHSGVLAALLALFVGSASLLLYRKAHQDLVRRQQVAHALQHSNDLLNGILSASPVGIGLVDNRVFQWMNAAGRRMFGFASETDFAGKRSRMIYDNEEEYKRVGKLVYDNLKQGRTAEADAVLRRMDGSRFPAHIQIASPDPKRPMRHTVFAISDETWRQTAQKEAIAREKLEGIIEIAGTICHELSQPMMVISGLTEIALEKIDGDNVCHPELEKISRQIERMSTITQKLMRITRYSTCEYTAGEKIIDLEKAAAPDKDN